MQTSTQYKKDSGLRVRVGNYEQQLQISMPAIQKPQPLGFFSVNTDRDYEPTAQQLRYYKQPPAKNMPLDLNKGLQLAIKKPESAHDEGLEFLLKFIYDHSEKLSRSTSGGRHLPGVEFVCWRGLLRLIMCTPYEFRQDWCIHVTRYMGTFYLCKRDTEQERFQRTQETEQQQTMSAWGFKFEQYCLAESPFIEPDTNAPVDECAEFTCVFKSKMGGLDLMYGAEMDGIVSEQPVKLEETNLENLKFVELKVRKGNLSQHQFNSYNRHKTRNWWCQSFLVGITDLYVGMRNDKGFVQHIEHVEVRSLPKLGVNHWSPPACANFLLQFFTCLKKIMANVNCSSTTYEFYFNSETARITYECLEGVTPHSFLPDWYVALIKRTSGPNVESGLHMAAGSGVSVAVHSGGQLVRSVKNTSQEPLL